MMKRVIINLAYKILRVYWQIFKPVTLGARAIVVGSDEKILLVKHTYQDHWFIPGGGVKKSETFGQAIRRELIEEAGYEASRIELFGIYQSTLEGKRDNIAVFVCRDGNFIESSRLSSPDSFEIETHKFFGIDSLPENTSRGSRKRIEEYFSPNPDDAKRFGIW